MILRVYRIWRTCWLWKRAPFDDARVAERTSCLKDETAGRLLQNGRRRTVTCYVPWVLFGEAIEDIHELRQPLRFFGFTLPDTFRDASLDVVLENGETDPVQRRFCSRELLKNVDAEPRLLHHAPDAANLSFDPVQSRDEALLLCLIQHEVSPERATHHSGGVHVNYAAELGPFRGRRKKPRARPTARHYASVTPPRAISRRHRVARNP